MNIDPTDANTLCKMIVTNLSKWPSLMASLQSGKGEINKAGIVETAISTWLSKCLEKKELLVLMEHNNIDYALIDRKSIETPKGTPKLSVEGVIEFKFNYATQPTEIRDRLKGKGIRKSTDDCWQSSAMEQAALYATIHGRKRKDGKPALSYAYVLYLIAKIPVPDPVAEVHKKNPEDVDSGWGFLLKNKNLTIEDAIQQISSSIEDLGKKVQELKLIGQFFSGNINEQEESALYCCLIQVPVDFKDPGRGKLAPCSNKLHGGVINAA